jgi:Skp family chaperone for outer membrane proteins
MSRGLLLRFVVLLSAITLPGAVYAQSAWGGALQGLGEGLQRWADQEEQRQLMREQHDREMQRLEREHALRMEALRREAEYRQQLDEEQHKRQRQAELEREAKQRQQAAIERQQEQSKRAQEEQHTAAQMALVEEKHPGWGKAVNTQNFKNWLSRQPESLKRLSGSDKAEDAITLLDLYKRDQRKSR